MRSGACLIGMVFRLRQSAAAGGLRSGWRLRNRALHERHRAGVAGGAREPRLAQQSVRDRARCRTERTAHCGPAWWVVWGLGLDTPGYPIRRQHGVTLLLHFLCYPRPKRASVSPRDTRHMTWTIQGSSVDSIRRPPAFE
jgi:hypothetical protein